jgi:hypothetical protein
MMGALAHWGYSVALLYALIVIVIRIASGDTWLELAAVAVVIPLLAAAKGALRTMAVEDLLPEWRETLRKWNWVWTMLSPAVPFLFSWNFAMSLASRRVRWRGVTYELVSPTTTRILSR